MIEYLGSFKVVPSLPKEIESLRYIVKNLLWAWDKDTVALFRRLDKDLWESTYHNPVQMLGEITQNRLDEVANDNGFIAHLNRVNDNLKSYLKKSAWFQDKHSDEKDVTIAYFSAEFGLTECLQIYSGGLGVLAGDHLKSASDLGIPLVAVGLNYKEGYFQQYLNTDGWQQERYQNIDYHNQPMELETDKEGNAIKISVTFPGREVYAQIWKIEVGRVKLYVLDTNINENSEEDRKITHGLYSGDLETRIKQEIILGIGGIRALQALGIKPQICHMNEGHSAFLALERIRHLQKSEALSFKEAKDVGFYSSIFTTHTPVPAGIDVFPNELVEKYFGNFYRKELKISDKEFYALGTILDEKNPPNFNMAHLAMNMAGYVNGVSKLHGEVSRKMWVDGFKGIPFNEIPIDYVTNGIHTRSHLSSEMEALLYRYLGDGFINSVPDKDVWKSVLEIPDEELWRTHVRRRERLVAFTRKRLREQVIKQGGSREEIEGASEVLDSTVLTIGFARRFATYKRATLLFRDVEKLISILNNSERPVQIIIAGKAHPHDDAGKKLIQNIFEYAKTPELRKRIVFLENYDMNVARYMVQGCDVWLNNPRRPYEASGTSGMKIIANGGLNFSVLDGWWDEASTHEVGWNIGGREDYTNLDYQDMVESNMLYKILKKNIASLFYKINNDGLPREWIKMMKTSMSQLAPVFNTHRMVHEYTEKFYLKAYDNRKNMVKNNWQKVKEFTAWKANLLDNWSKIKFISVTKSESNNDIKVGSKYKISSEVSINNLTKDDIEVQIYYGKFDNMNVADKNLFVSMECVHEDTSSGIYKYEGSIVTKATGEFGYTLRILPKHSLLINQFELGVIKWVEKI